MLFFFCFNKSFLAHIIFDSVIFSFSHFHFHFLWAFNSTCITCITHLHRLILKLKNLKRSKLIKKVAKLHSHYNNTCGLLDSSFTTPSSAIHITRLTSILKWKIKRSLTKTSWPTSTMCPMKPQKYLFIYVSRFRDLPVQRSSQNRTRSWSKGRMDAEILTMVLNQYNWEKNWPDWSKKRWL